MDAPAIQTLVDRQAAAHWPLLLAGGVACAAVAVSTVRGVVENRLRRRRRRQRSAEARGAFRQRVMAVAAEARARQDPRLAWEGLRDLRVSAIEDECRDVKSFYLASVDGHPLPAYQPGQYLTIHLPRGRGDKPVVRCYTLSDRPREEFYRLSVKRCAVPASPPGAPPGVGSTILHDGIKVGDVLKAAAPRGDFFLAPLGDEPVVLIGGGIGVTPLASMLAAQVHAGRPRETYVLLGMRSREEHPLKQRVEDLAAAQPQTHLFTAYSKPGPGDRNPEDYQHRGRLDMEFLRKVLPSNDYTFYLCGPPAMMESLVPGLLDWGVPDDRIHFEAFGPASVPRKGATTAAKGAVGAEVKFARSGKTTKWSADDKTLLDVAERMGVPMDAGCRVGNCGACATRIVEGKTTTVREPGAPCPTDECLACVSVPTGSLVLNA